MSLFGSELKHASCGQCGGVRWSRVGSGTWECMSCGLEDHDESAGVWLDYGYRTDPSLIDVKSLTRAQKKKLREPLRGFEPWDEKYEDSIELVEVGEEYECKDCGKDPSENHGLCKNCYEKYPWKCHICYKKRRMGNMFIQCRDCYIKMWGACPFCGSPLFGGRGCIDKKTPDCKDITTKDGNEVDAFQVVLHNRVQSCTDPGTHGLPSADVLKNLRRDNAAFIIDFFPVWMKNAGDGYWQLGGLNDMMVDGMRKFLKEGVESSIIDQTEQVKGLVEKYGMPDPDGWHDPDIKKIVRNAIDGSVMDDAFVAGQAFERCILAVPYLMEGHYTEIKAKVKLPPNTVC